MTGVFTDVQRFSVHDGPGIRTLFFFKGCPLRCPWCCNPETQSSRPELLHHAFKCIQCESCVEVCTPSALRPTGSPFIAVEQCTLCGECVCACPSGALRLVGEEMSVERVMEVAERDRLFYDNSGGGVTFSGGEPLLQAEFLEQALGALQHAGIHTAVETTGFADWPLLERLESKTDLFLYDVKIIDKDAHHRLLGVPDAVIIGNLRRLAQLRDRIVVRIPVVPGFTTVGDNIPRIFELIASLPRPRTVHLLPYHGLGRSKYTSGGRTYPAEGTRPPGPELLEELTAAAARLGLDCTVGG